MEFRLDAEQELVEKTARSLAQSHAAKLPRLAVNDVINPEPSTERLETIEACWSELVTLGFTALLIPSDAGGAGGTLLDGVLVAEALAYHLVPVPYAGSAIIATTLLNRCESTEGRKLLSSLAQGGRSSLAVGADLLWPPRIGRAVAWDWLPGDTAVISTPRGAKALRTAGGLPCADPLRRLGSVDADVDLASVDDDPFVLAVARIACAAQLTGLARRARDMAADHARNREQFGSPIGAFQAVQQLLADCHVAAESSRSVLLGAAWSVGADEASAEHAGAAAFAVCAEAAGDATTKAMQVMGGIGATWESDAHVLLRSARLVSAAFGGVPAAHETLGRELVEA